MDIEEKQIFESILVCAVPLCLPTSQLWILDECLNFIRKWKRLKHINLELVPAAEPRRLTKVESRVRSLLELRHNRPQRKYCLGISIESWIRFSGGYPVKVSQITWTASRTTTHRTTKQPTQRRRPQQVKAAVWSLNNWKSPGVDKNAAEVIKARRSRILPHRSYRKLIAVSARTTTASASSLSLARYSQRFFRPDWSNIASKPAENNKLVSVQVEAAGFRPGQGCCDQMFAIRQLIK